MRKEQRQGKRNQADRLIDYALDSGAELFIDQVGAPHALVNGEALALNSRSYNWLRSRMWDEEEISVSSEALKTAAGTLAAFAAKSGKVRELHTRSAFHDGAIYYQLRPGRCARINRDGWEFDQDPAVVFRSIPNLKPLPDPQPGGNLDALEELVNLKSERDKRMFKVYAVTVALPHIPRPILQTTGVMGSGKTTAGRVIKRLLDPTSPETVRMDPRDFLQKASHSYIVMLDNLNSIPEWGVDTLCRLVTGEADSKRSLYTDDEDFIYEMKRAVLLNGINAPTERGDAQDRTLPVELERIPDRHRRSEESLWAVFEEEHGKLLGAIFDTLARTLAARDTVRLARRPRLADWGEYAAAVYEALGWGVGEFLEDWSAVVKVQNQGTLEGSSVAQAILSFMENRNEWTGLASDLHAKLEVEAEELNINIKKDKTWPKSPSWLWRRMREVLPLLTAMGVDATTGSTRKTGTQITLTKVPTGGGPDGGSKSQDAATDAATTNAAKESASEGSGSRGSIYGQSSTSLSCHQEEKGENQGENGSKTHTGRGFTTNAATDAATKQKRRLTEE
ncbi:MAG TPA: hypothetical protein VGW38_25165, partial [Chloroflexota bacterium]|nr:hypothetical protein [Chloroflexota bacterium]